MWRIVVVDVEASGGRRIFKNIVPYHNLLEIGAVEVILHFGVGDIGRKFHGVLKPLNNNYDPEAIKKTSGKSLEYYIKHGKEPSVVIRKLYSFLLDIKVDSGRRVLMASDNPEFDVGWIRLYLELFGYNAHELLYHNPMSLKDLARGLTRDLRMNLYRLPLDLRVNLPHTHNALDDALRNACILLKIAKKLKK